MALHITGDPAADELLSTDAFALLTGMLLDQQVAMETAFAGPLKISERAGSIAPEAVAGYDPERFVARTRASESGSTMSATERWLPSSP